LTEAREEREELARRSDGSALGRRRDARGGHAFRRVSGDLPLPALHKALDAEVAKTVGPLVHDEDINAA
jgi:hypothetical protein